MEINLDSLSRTPPGDDVLHWQFQQSQGDEIPEEVQSVKEQLRASKTKFITEQTDALTPTAVWLARVGMASITHTHKCSLTVEACENKDHILRMLNLALPRGRSNIFLQDHQEGFLPANVIRMPAHVHGCLFIGRGGGGRGEDTATMEIDTEHQGIVLS